MAPKLDRDEDWFERRYLSFARSLCGEGASKERAREFCKQVRESLPPETLANHDRVIDQFLNLKERLLRRQDLPTTLKAAEFLYPKDPRLGGLPGPEKDWIPFVELLSRLEPPFCELDLLERALMGVRVHGWPNYQQAAGLFREVFSLIKLDANYNFSLRAIADVVDNFCEKLIAEITRRDSRCEWVLQRLLVREAKIDFSTWTSICQVHRASSVDDHADEKTVIRKVARTLSSKAAYARGKICDAMPLEKFIRDRAI